MSDTIYALSSAAGRAAVAVVRISGAAAADVLSAMAGGPPPPRRAMLRNIIEPHTGEVIDRALVLYFKAPHSATGEDLAELHLHGGRAVLQAVYDALARFDDCRPAEPGEFARRGFDHGKIDLTAAEGIADLIDAETEAQRRQAQRQAGGALAELYDTWRRQLIEARALVEAAIDFSDEGDVGEQAYAGAERIIAALTESIDKHLAGARQAEIIRSGYRVVIAGPPNAGKSSLLNALARRDAAIVSDDAGTTRDVIEVHMDLDGLPVVCSDTAGIRETSAKVEQEGIRRAIDRARQADLVLWVEDVTASPPMPLPHELTSIATLKVWNKIDLQNRFSTEASSTTDVYVSVKQAQGLDDLVDVILRGARRATSGADQAVPTNARHRRHLRIAREQLNVFLAAEMSALELRAEDLRIAAAEVGRLTGRIDVEDVLDQIFSRFCVGK